MYTLKSYWGKYGTKSATYVVKNFSFGIRKDIVRNNGCFLVVLVLLVPSQEEKEMTLGKGGSIPGN